MPLSTGLILNHRYRIVKLLGQGGFGAVYRAWDMNLSRPCAVKENLDASAEAQQQFGREATILANLNHPNLARVTDYFFLPGQGQYLVMDFVAGQDLQQLLEEAGAPLPEVQALDWITQVCDALVYLHDQNPPIIHRDIKPANIKITPAGKAILVDFGIAKIYDQNLKTTVGARAVTPGFSPPEQYGMGKTGPRSDIYALGATLYTLLTGQAPLESIDRTVGKTLLAPRALNPAISAAAEQAILGAMEMVPAARLSSAGQFANLLAEPLFVQNAQPTYGAQPFVAPVAAIPVKPVIKMPIMLAAGGLMLLSLVFLGARSLNNLRNPPISTPNVVAVIPERTQTSTASALPGGVQSANFSPTPSPTVTLTPTPSQTATPGPARAIVYASIQAGNFEIMRMQIDGSEKVNLTNNSSNDLEPACSPDGEKIAFASKRDGNYEIYVMNSDGSGAASLTSHPGEDRTPTWSPDGGWIAFYSNRDGSHQIYKMRPDGSQVTRLTGDPGYNGFPAWSPDGQWIAFQSDRDGHNEAYVMRPDGSQQTRLTHHENGNLTPAVSPDGRQVVFMSFRHSNRVRGEIYVMDFIAALEGPEKAPPLRLTDHPEMDWSPAWSPDGRQIVFSSSRNGNYDIFVMDADGSGLTQLTFDAGNDQYPVWLR